MRVAYLYDTPPCPYPAGRYRPPSRLRARTDPCQLGSRPAGGHRAGEGGAAAALIAQHTTRVFVLLVLALLGAVAIGLIRGGTLEALRRIHVTRLWLLAAVVLAILAGRLVPGLHVPGWIAATMLMALFAAANSRLPGLGLVLAGMVLNAVVITANGAMPVSVDRAARIGIDPAGIQSSRLLEPLGDDTVLGPAASVIPFPFPGAHSMISIGDVLVASGAGLFGAVAPVRARRTLDARRRRAGSGRRGAARSARSARPADGAEDVGLR